MSSAFETAREFFDACETGKGWEACSQYCHENATFACQADTLAEISILGEYCEWMKGMMTPVPDGRYELKFFAQDPSSGSVAAVAIFHGTQTGPGGPVPPTNKTIAADYVYQIDFDGDRIRHMTKVWNDAHSLRQLGWA